MANQDLPSDEPPRADVEGAAPAEQMSGKQPPRGTGDSDMAAEFLRDVDDVLSGEPWMVFDVGPVTPEAKRKLAEAERD